MGWLDSTTTVKNEIPEPSYEEKKMMSYITDFIIPMQADAAGYIQTGYTSYWDSPQGKKTSRQVEIWQKKLDEAQTPEERASAEQGLQGWKNTQSKEFNDYVPIPTFREKEPLELENARSRYGEDSEQYRELKAKYDADIIAKEKMDHEIEMKTREVTFKYLDGDFTIRPDQAELIQRNYAPQRAAIEQLYNDITAEAEKTGSNLTDITNKTFDEFEKRIRETGMMADQALISVGRTILQTDKNMNDALTNTIDVHRNLMQMGIEDYTGEVTSKISANAAALGRSPDDPEYQADIVSMVAKEVQRGSLNLAAMEAEGKLRISERTGGALEQLGYQRAGLAERTGERLERATLGRGEQEMRIAERTGGLRETATQQMGLQRLGVEEGITERKFAVGAGMAPSQAQLGMGMTQFQQAQLQSQFAMMQGLGTTPMQYLSLGQRERMAQGTQTTTSSASPMSAIMGGLAMGGEIAGGVMTAGAYNAAKGAIS